MARNLAMNVLGNGLYEAGHYEDALPVQEAELPMLRRIGASEARILAAQNNLSNTYQALGRFEAAMCLRRDVYSRHLKLNGEEDGATVLAANNYALSLLNLQRYTEIKSLLRRLIPVARRVLGDNNEFTIRMRWNYANALYEDDGAPLDDLREAVNTLEDTERIARRVLGGAHPVTTWIEDDLQNARAALHAREMQPTTRES